MQLNADAQKIINDLRADEDKYIKILKEDNATLEAHKVTLQEDNLAKDEIIKTQDNEIKELNAKEKDNSAKDKIIKKQKEELEELKAKIAEL